MAPWEKYAQQGPWAKYTAPAAVSPRQAEDESIAAYNSTLNAPPETLQDKVKRELGLKDYRQRGTILPIGENEDKSLEFAWPQVAIDIMQAVALPKHAVSGGQYTATDALGASAIMSPVSTATRAGARAIPTVTTTHVPAKPKVPTTAELKSAADSGYKTAADLGVDYSASSVKGMADDIARKLDQEGRIAELNPELFALLGKLRNPPADSVASLNSLDAFRKRLGDIAGSKDPAKAAAATIAIKRIDEFIQTHDPASVVARTAPPQGITAPAAAGHNFGPGDAAFSRRAAADAADAITAARGNSAAAFRSDRLTGLEETAELRAAAANSGQNLGNTIRQRLTSLLTSHNQSRGYSKEEIAAIQNLVEGTGGANALRRLSNMLGGGGGLGQTLMAGLGASSGVATGDPLLAAVGATLPIAVGSGSRSLYNNLTKKQLSHIDEMVRARSPLYESRVANPGMDVNVPEGRAALIRALLSSAAQGEEGGRFAKQSRNGLMAEILMR